MNFSINLIDNINTNSGSIEVVRKSPFRLITSTKNEGLTSEQKIYNITGSTRSKKRILIASVIIKVSSNELRFMKSPYLSSKNNIKLITTKIGRHTSGSGHKHINSYEFDVYYYNTSSVSKESGINASIFYRNSAIPKRGGGVFKLNKLNVGKAILNKHGDTRKITISGTPGTTVTFTIKDDSGLSNLGYPNTTFKDTPAHKCTIDSSGSYSYEQNFRSIVVRGTSVNGAMAASGTDKIIFDDLTGVKVGDRLALSSNPHSTTTYEVTELNPDHDNKNECLVSPNFTAADNTAVRFTRSREYTLNIEETNATVNDITFKQSPNGVGCYAYWSQYRDPILTIRLTPSNYKISHFNGVSTGPLADGVSHDVKYTGRSFVDDGREIDFSYVLDVGVGHTFRAFTIPRYAKNLDTDKRPDTSHWANSNITFNGGTDLKIDNWTSTTLSAQTLTISGKLTINKLGRKDLIVELDLDKVTENTK